MDTSTLNILTNIGVKLTELAVKGTATAINGKIESIKTEKNADRIRTTYDEIVNQLLSEREEAIRIAQIYKEELDKVSISDEDIKHLHNTVTKILEILKVMSPQNQALDNFNNVKELISVDTLKTMQLLGFNYKAAIGEPLTQIYAKAITNLGANNKKGVNKMK